MFTHLRTKLTVLYAGLFAIALMLISLAVYEAVSGNARRITRQELVASGTVFDRLWSLRAKQMQDGAALLAHDFGFRAAVATHDTATIKSAVENLRQRIGIDLVFIVGVDGSVLASDGRPMGEAAQSIAGVLQSEDFPAGVMTVNGRPYQAAAVPILSPTLTGWVVFATELDAQEMRALEQLSAIPLEAVVLSRQGGTWTLPGSHLGGSEQAALSRFIDRSLAGHDGPATLMTASGPAIALAKPLKSMADGQPATLLLRYPMKRALAPYRALTWIILFTGLVGMALLIVGSWALARTLTRPISALDDAVHRLQQGETVAVAVATQDEIGRLAGSFNAMAAEIGARERRITHLAMHDGETDLPNRLALERRLEARVAGGCANAVVAAVGIERYSHLRAAIGHQAAAVLVRELAARITTLLPQAGVARLSSDTLGLVLFASDPASARTQAADLAAALGQPVKVAGATVDIGVTIGLADGPVQADEAIEQAGIAVEQARAARLAVAVFDAEAYGDPASNLSLMSEMLDGLTSSQIYLNHQPKHDIRKGRVTAVEALVRWRHPARGFIPPDRFIPLAEDTGHIRALSEWVLREAIAQQAAMKRAGFDLDMSVNISGRLLSDLDFAEVALGLTRRAEGRICFEITETAVMDNPDLALQLIERFSGAGLGISIDDYGSGLSSLAYLKQIKADELKIDKAFILNLADNARDALLVRSTVDLAHSLNLKVTAEGVETQTAYALLAGMGCDIAQGYLIARPMPLEGVVEFLKAGEVPGIAAVG